MLGKIRNLGRVGKLKALPELGQATRVRGPLVAPIAMKVRLGLFGPRGDPLEEFAIRSDIGTLPERIVWKWLEDGGYQYEYQLAAMGGRDVVGGAVLDFIVYDLAGRPVAIRVQGEYWHSSAFPSRQARDDEQYYRLVAMGYAVVDLWEQRIYDAAMNKRLTQYILGEVSRAL